LTKLIGSQQAYYANFHQSGTHKENSVIDDKKVPDYYTAYADSPIMTWSRSNYLDAGDVVIPGCASGAGYDHRCQAWWLNIVGHMDKWKADHAGTLTGFSDQHSIIVSDIRISYDGEKAIEMCAPRLNTAGTALYSVTCLTYNIGVILPILRSSYALIRKTGAMEDLDYGFFMMKKDKLGKWQSLIMTSWMADEDGAKTKNLNNYPDIKQWVAWQQTQGAKFNTTSEFDYDRTLGESTTEVTISTIPIEVKMFADGGGSHKMVQYALLGVTIKSGWFHSNIKSLIKDAQTTGTLYVICLILICLVIFVMSIILSWRLGVYLASSFDLLLYLLIEIELTNETKRSQDIKGKPREITQLYNCYINTRDIVTNAVSITGGNNSLALMHFSLALKLFNHVDNKLAASIILNNMGNVNVRLGRYDAAVANYKQSLLVYDES
jgi:hypothetical protein